MKTGSKMEVVHSAGPGYGERGSGQQIGPNAAGAFFFFGIFEVKTGVHPIQAGGRADDRESDRPTGERHHQGAVGGGLQKGRRSATIKPETWRR